MELRSSKFKSSLRSVLLFGNLISLLQCQHLINSTPCGSFYSEENLSGQTISFSDGDQSINLQDDLRVAGSWPGTKSIEVRNACSMEICNETYFDGECHTLNQGQYPVQDVNVTDIASARCICEKECKCEDIFMKKSSCARAYLEGGCQSCNAQYVDLDSTEGLPPNRVPKVFPESYMNRVNAFRLRKGCMLTLFSEEGQNNQMITSEIVEGFEGSIESYECHCDDSEFVPKPKATRPESYPALIDIPTNIDDLHKMLMDERYSSHPGLKAAHQSIKSGRSSKNAYLMLLGSTGSGKSTTINLLFDNPNVTVTGDGKSTTTDIHEFRIPVPIDEFGVANSELRVIDTPGLGDTRGVGQDAMFLATLDFFLATHEELKDRIPNVVLIFHKFNDNRFNGKGSGFVQMLRGLDSFRGRITDDNYSNVIFVLTHFCSETNKIKRRPEIRLAQFKEVIEDFSQFPRPTLISIAENKPEEYGLAMVNGYARLPNNEFYPRNLFEKIALVTETSEDQIGSGVFRTAFRDSENFNISSSTTTLLPNQNDKVAYYYGILSNALVDVIDTEISQLLKHVWDEKLDIELKRKFPDSLAYLQKTLNLRNTNTMADVPKTTTAILDLLSTVKHDEATMALLKNSLGIKAPAFPGEILAGRSYNVFKDTHLLTFPFVMGNLTPSDIGFMIPKSISVRLEPGNKEHFHVFDDKKEYIQYRLQNLGIEGIIPDDLFTGSYKPGCNIKSIAFKNDSCIISAAREVRLFEFKVNERLDFSEEFQTAITNLVPFNASDPRLVELWNAFFNEYGTHIVSSIHGGGRIEIELQSDEAYNSGLSQALFDLIKFAEEMSFLIINADKGNETGRGVFTNGIQHSLKFIGGDSAYHTTDLTKMSMENAAMLLTNWKKSLKYNPVMLNTEMTLIPIGQIVKRMGQNYSTEIERATYLLFNSTLKFIPPKKKSDAQPGYSRDQTSVINPFMEQMAANNAMLQQMMANINAMESQRQRRNEELEKKRLEYQMQERENERKFQEANRIAHEKSEQERREFEREIAKEEHRLAMELEQRQARFREDMSKQQTEMSNRNRAIIETVANLTLTQAEEERKHELEISKIESEKEAQRLLFQAEQNRLKSEKEIQIEEAKIKQKEIDAETERKRLELEAEHRRTLVEKSIKLEETKSQDKQRDFDMQIKLLEIEADRNKTMAEHDLEIKKQEIMAKAAADSRIEQLRIEAQERRRQLEIELEQKHQSRLSEILNENANRNEEQRRYFEDIMRQNREASERDRQLLEEKIKENKPGCLKSGTKILMADGNEKNVEHLKYGDLVLDMDMLPSKVIGVNYRYLQDFPFNGFDNTSYFFTGDHMFVGTDQALKEPSNNIQLYVRSIHRLIENNPLMKFWDVKEMEGVENLHILYYNKTLKSVVPSVVDISEDLQRYPVDTPVYFILVDSPSYTYFANGYVCKVDVPPVERWPNTMSLLFNVMRNPSFMKLSEMTYSIGSIAYIEDLASNLTQTVTAYLDSPKADNMENVVLMALEGSYVEECLHKIFNEPTASLIAVSVYSKLGNMLSLALDNNNSQDDMEQVAHLQHDLYRIITAQLKDSVTYWKL